MMGYVIGICENSDCEIKETCKRWIERETGVLFKFENICDMKKDSRRWYWEVKTEIVDTKDDKNNKNEVKENVNNDYNNGEKNGVKENVNKNVNNEA